MTTKSKGKAKAARKGPTKGKAPAKAKTAEKAKDEVKDPEQNEEEILANGDPDASLPPQGEVDPDALRDPDAIDDTKDAPADEDVDQNTEDQPVLGEGDQDAPDEIDATKDRPDLDFDPIDPDDDDDENEDEDATEGSLHAIIQAMRSDYVKYHRSGVKMNIKEFDKDDNKGVTPDEIIELAKSLTENYSKEIKANNPNAQPLLAATKMEEAIRLLTYGI